MSGIDRTIEYYEDLQNEILDFINMKDELNRKHRLGSDIIISKAKELEIIGHKLSVLMVAKCN